MFVTARKLLASNKGFCAGATSLGLAYLVSEGVDGKHASHNRIYAAAASLGKVSYSFGNNLFGQLGLGNDEKQIAPILVESISQNEDVSFIDAGYDQSAFVTTSGKLFTAGCGAHCRLGLGRSDSNQTVPQAVESLAASKVKSVAIGGFHMLCLWKTEKCTPLDVTTLHSLATTTLNLARLKKLTTLRSVEKKLCKYQLGVCIQQCCWKREKFTLGATEEMVPWAMAIRVSKASQS